jgi:hypothetical protein
MPGPLIPPSPEEALAGKQLTPRMLRVIAAAADEAERRGHSFVGTEHALLGLLSEPDGIAVVVLRRLGAADAAATETHKIMDSEGYNRPQPDPVRRGEWTGQVIPAYRFSRVAVAQAPARPLERLSRGAPQNVAAGGISGRRRPRRRRRRTQRRSLIAREETSDRLG